MSNHLRTKLTIMRIADLPTADGIAKHNRRDSAPENADPKLAHLNGIQRDIDDKTSFGCAWGIIADGIVPDERASPVVGLTIELPEDARDMWPSHKVEAWLTANAVWIVARYGDLVMQIVSHRDEQTPHTQVLLVPKRNGRIAQRQLFGARDLRQLHTDYQQQVGATFGLQRGLEGSRARHQDLKAYRLAAKAGTPPLCIPKWMIPKVPTWFLTEAQREQYIVSIETVVNGHFGKVGATLHAKASHHDRARQDAEGHLATLVLKVAEIADLRLKLENAEAALTNERAKRIESEQLLATTIDSARATTARATKLTTDCIPAADIICSLGYPVTHISNGHSVISIGDKQIALDAAAAPGEQDPTGHSLGLVREMTPWSTSEAFAHLVHHFGDERATGAMIKDLLNRARSLLPPPVPLPSAEASTWPVVRERLIARGWPDRGIDLAHQNGVLFANSDGDTIILKRTLSGEVTGFLALGHQIGRSFVRDFDRNTEAAVRFGASSSPSILVLCRTIPAALAVAQLGCPHVQSIPHRRAPTPWASLQAAEAAGAIVLYYPDNKDPDWGDALTKAWPAHLQKPCRAVSLEAITTLSAGIKPSHNLHNQPEIFGIQPDEEIDL